MFSVNLLGVQKEKEIRMKQFFAFVRKEFAHVFRDRKTLLMLFGLPVAQIVLFGFALSNEVKNTRIVILDHSNDAASQRLIRRMEASAYFDVERNAAGIHDVEAEFLKGKVKAALIIPPEFSSGMAAANGNLQIIADASDPNLASAITAYLNAIINDFVLDELNGDAVPYAIIPEVKMFYNPELRGAPNFVPGVMALILMLVCVMMTSVSIVREKESGTMEVLLVSPFKPLLVIVAKTIPYLFISILNVASILLLSSYVLMVPVKGSIVLLFAESILFILTALSLGILISTRTSSQQTAMMISMMGMMLPTLLFTGFMFPIENMPLPLQVLSNAVPSRWYYIIVKDIMIKGSGFSAVWMETLILCGMTVVLLLLSLKNFKTRLA
jgi:ABC-2 type transport system permease protein